ncbi:MAG TPA: hypothetical protein VM600_07045, partial [Actinomycetota bacterium]|nr:hypothetical protein [Actinomycetota bacterium]
MEPKDFARIILRRRKTVITAIVITVLVAFVGSMRTTPEYVAQCEVLYQAVAYDPTEPNAKPFESIGSLADNARFIKNSLTGAVLKRVGLPAEAVIGKLADVEVPEGEQIFILRVADKPGGEGNHMAGFDPAQPGKRAGEICNAYAYQYVQFKQDAARNNYEKLLASKRRAQTSIYKQVEQVEQRIRAANGDQELALT